MLTVGLLATFAQGIWSGLFQNEEFRITNRTFDVSAPSEIVFFLEAIFDDWASSLSLKIFAVSPEAK